MPYVLRIHRAFPFAHSKRDYYTGFHFGQFVDTKLFYLVGDIGDNIWVLSNELVAVIIGNHQFATLKTAVACHIVFIIALGNGKAVDIANRVFKLGFLRNLLTQYLHDFYRFG